MICSTVGICRIGVEPMSPQIRGEEKEKNTQTISDSKDAQKATSQAVTVLKEFYAKAGKATALIQQVRGTSACA
jgi:hypothetical protein